MLSTFTGGSNLPSSCLCLSSSCHNTNSETPSGSTISSASAPLGIIFGNSGRFVDPNGMNILRARIALCNAAVVQKERERKRERERRKTSEFFASWKLGKEREREKEREKEREFSFGCPLLNPLSSLFSRSGNERESFKKENENISPTTRDCAPVWTAPPGTNGRKCRFKITSSGSGGFKLLKTDAYRIVTVPSRKAFMFCSRTKFCSCESGIWYDSSSSSSSESSSSSSLSSTSISSSSSSLSEEDIARCIIAFKNGARACAYYSCVCEAFSKIDRKKKKRECV